MNQQKKAPPSEDELGKHAEALMAYLESKRAASTDLISEAELMEKFQCRTRAKLRRRLDKLRIPYHFDGEVIVTTIQAINAPLLGNTEPDKVEFV